MEGFSAGAAHFFAELFDDGEHDGAEEDDEHRELPVQPEREAQRHERFDGFLDGLAQDCFEAVLQALGVLNQAACDVAGAF